MSNDHSHRVSSVIPPVSSRFVGDEDLSAAGNRPSPCFYSRISDEDLSAAGLSAAGMAKCRPLGCVIGDEDLSSAGMVRPQPNCSCFVSDTDEELLADSGQSN